MAVTAGKKIAGGDSDEAREGDDENEFHLGSEPHFAGAFVCQLDVGECFRGYQVDVTLAVFQTQQTRISVGKLAGDSFFQLLGGFVAVENDFAGRVSNTNLNFHVPSVRQSAVGFNLEG